MAASHTSEAEPQFDQTAPIRRVHVLLPLPLASAYDYAVPPQSETGEMIEVGDFVAVPLGRRTVIGVVWGEGSADPDNAVADSRLRPIAQRLPVPAMAEVTRRFVEWLADYTCAAPGAVLRMTMSVPAAAPAPGLYPGGPGTRTHDRGAATGAGGSGRWHQHGPAGGDHR